MRELTRRERYMAADPELYRDELREQPAPRKVFMLLREGFKSYDGFYYSREDAEAAGQRLKANKAWPTDKYRIVTFIESTND